MLDMPSIITAKGDLSIHGREGVYITFTFEDEAGLPRNVSTAKMVFETPYFERELTNGTGLDEKVLSVAPGEMPNTIGKLVDFIVREETGSVPHIIWSGKLIMTGWYQ